LTRQAYPQLLRLREGRQLEIFAAGDPDAVPVVMNHGTPGCGMLFSGWVEEAASRGLRLVGYSRPGYGESDRREGRVVAYCASDVAAAADAVGADRFYVAGHSGGGSHALACAALLPERVIAVATVAAPVPQDAPGLDWLAGQHPVNVEEYEASLAGGETLRSLLEGVRADLLGELDEGSGPEDDDDGESFFSAADEASITEAGSAFARERRRHALAPGIWGWFDDNIAEVTPWGFDLDSIAVPVAIWHGGEDRLVPFAHGEWLAAHVPGASPRLLPGEGHISIIESRFGEVVDDLLALGR
jgi:pimeloyl-ACP methyl ester carboxylesterase